MKARTKDILRTIHHEKKRFVSLAVISALGVVMLTGLKGACTDLRYSADSFFDNQKLFDLRIQSTLGLTDEDIEALKKLPGISDIEGTYSETVYTYFNDKKQTAAMTLLSEKDFNKPYILSGRLPEKADEIAVTSKYLSQTGKSLGDTLNTEESEHYVGTEYTIVGEVVDACDINSAEGAVSFRSTTSTDYTFFVCDEAVTYDVYTALYLQVAETTNLNCYSDEYESLVSDVKTTLEKEIKADREKARTDSIKAEAQDELDEKKQEGLDKLSDAEKEIADAENELRDGRQKLEDGILELNEKEQEGKDAIADGRRQLTDGLAQLADGQAQLDQALAEFREKTAQFSPEIIAEYEKQFADKQAEIDAGRDELDKNESLLDESEQEAKKQIEDGRIQLEAGRQELEAGQAELDAALAEFEQSKDMLPPEMAAAYEQQFADKQAEIDAGRTTLDENELLLNEQEQQADEQFKAARQQIQENRQKLEDGQTQLTQALNEFKEKTAQFSPEIIASYEQQFAEKQAEINAGKEELLRNAKLLDEKEQEANQKIAEARQEIEENRKKLDDGQAELEDGKKEYLESKKEFEEKIADAQQEIDEIEAATWYIEDRSTLSGYTNVKSDSTCIEAIGNVFPVVFLLVAVLISLTTATRMVEESRGLLGTYKALGFSNHAIRQKFTIFAVGASLIGGIVGDIGGFIVLPEIIFIIFGTMYQLPEFHLTFNYFSGIGGVLLFTLSIYAATYFSCRAELIQAPAALMRPLSPKAGKTLLLERIPFIWNHLSFLNKVTARNIFRYKKRLFMTVGGIMGCTALLICGFAIKDSVAALLPGQYKDIYHYDILTVSTEPDDLYDALDGNKQIESWDKIYTTKIKLTGTNGQTETVQMMVFPDDLDVSRYFTLFDEASNQAIDVDKNGITVTKNLSVILDFKENDVLSIQDLELNQTDVRVNAIVMNYLGNMIYARQSFYEANLTEFEANGALINVSDSCPDPAAFADELTSIDGVISAVSTKALEDDFDIAFILINMVVYVIIFLAASLAFVVLFTLSTTNISERERELSTIKVLGFYNAEVHLYINKETILLTILGTLLGIPIGTLLGNALTKALAMPSIYFAVTIQPVSYVISCSLSVLFAIMVNMFTNSFMDKINPIEALKSVE